MKQYGDSFKNQKYKHPAIPPQGTYPKEIKSLYCKKVLALSCLLQHYSQQTISGQMDKRKSDISTQWNTIQL
jgi:hypothetical protein